MANIILSIEHISPKIRKKTSLSTFTISILQYISGPTDRNNTRKINKRHKDRRWGK